MGDRMIRISLQRLEDMVSTKGPHRVPHRHPYHCEILWVEAGESQCFIEGQVYRLQAGDIFALPGGVMHSIGANPSLSGYVLHAVPELLAATPSEVLRGLRRANLAEHDQLLFSMQRWWAEFNQEYSQVRVGRAQAIKCLLRFLGVQLRRVPLARDQQRPQPVSVVFRKLLDEKFVQLRNTQHFAEQLGLTADQLRLRVREETGATPREHIDRKLMLEAKRLLAFSANSIADVATKLGFRDHKYFYQYFRKHTRQTPNEWRSQQREEFTNAGAPGLELPFG